MATQVVVIPPTAHGAKTAPDPVITQIPDAPVLPGVTFNGSPAEFIQFMRDLGAMQPAPVVEAPPAPLTSGQRFMQMVENTYWSIMGILRGIYNLAILVILCMLAAMALGYLPGISFGEDPAPISAPRSTGPSLNDKLDTLSHQIGEIKQDVDGLKATPTVEPPAPVVAEPAPVVEAPAAPAKKKGWRPFARAATPANP